MSDFEKDAGPNNILQKQKERKNTYGASITQMLYSIDYIVA